MHLFFTFLDKFNGSVPLKIWLQKAYTLGIFHMVLVAPEKIVSFLALNRERTTSMFMVLHFNVPGERATFRNSCHAGFKKIQNLGFLEWNSPCWLSATVSKMCRNVTAQSKLINGSVT